MSPIAIIFNGIHFYHPVAEKAFNHAKQHGNEVLALFFLAKSENQEGYGYPSDLDAAETLSTGADAYRDDRKIIDSYIRLLEHEAAAEKISFTARMMEDPCESDFLLAVEGCEIIFMQANNKGYEESIPAGIDAKKLLKHISIPIEIVP